MSEYRTSKLIWSDRMDLSYTQTFTVSSLGDLKKFFSQGLFLNLEEEKVQEIISGMGYFGQKYVSKLMFSI